MRIAGLLLAVAAVAAVLESPVTYFKSIFAGTIAVMIVFGLLPVIASFRFSHF
jgi:hypothetical protein